MKTLEQKLINYKFVKLNSFWYFWYVVLLGRGVYTKRAISEILYHKLNVGQARSIMLNLDNIWKVFLSNDRKSLYITTIKNNDIYKLKL